MQPGGSIPHLQVISNNSNPEPKQSNPCRKETSRIHMRWEDNRMDLKLIGVNMNNSIDSVQDMDYWRVIVITALNFRVP